MSLRKIVGLVAVFSSMGVYATGCSSSSQNYGVGNPDSGTGSRDSGGGQTDSSSGQDTSTGANDSSTSGNDSGGGVDSSSGDSATKDTGSPPPGDASSQDTSTDTSTVGDGSTATCSANTAFTALTWAPPTAFHQNKCTAAEGTAYNTSLMSAGPFTSGNAACDACIQTDQTAAAHGPIVAVLQGGVETPVSLNAGGCIANEETGAAATADKAAGGCGNQLNNASDCINQECGSCSDAAAPLTGGPFDTCAQAVLATGGICAADAITMTCNTELNTDGGIQTCLIDTLPQYITLWCGP
jgi:hypothetical protein